MAVTFRGIIMRAINRSRLTIVISVGLVLGLTGTVASIYLFDQPSIVFLQSAEDPSTVAVAALLSHFGDPTPYFTTSGLAFIYYRFRQTDQIKANISLYILLCSITPPFWVDILQPLFGRAQPHLLLENSIYTFQPLADGLGFRSFPSQHAAVAGAMAAAFSVLIPAYRPTFFLLCGMVMVSRVLTGAHYPSDVVAGMLVGVIMALLIRFAFDRYGINLKAVRRPWPPPS